ncbi:MAG: AI-2E family transporter [Bryobacteraceae bacterium]
MTLVLIIGLLYWARVFFITLITAVAIAFILDPLVNLLIRVRLPRSFASFVVCSLALGVMYLMGLGAYSQISNLVEDYQEAYGKRVGELVEQGRSQIERTEQAIYKLITPARQRKDKELEEQLKSSTRTGRKRAPAVKPALEPDPNAPPQVPEVRIQERMRLVDYVMAQWQSVYLAALMASFVPFLVYFMLSWRDHINRSFLQFFEGEDRAVAAKSLQGIAGLVRTYVVGNFVLGLLLAGISSVLFWRIGIPYPMLSGTLSGFLSLVPYVGLPLAVVPPILVSITVFQAISTYVLIGAVVAVLHLIALNLLYPKLVGSRVHLNPLVVTVALMIWGFLWDAAGLILAIPLTAGIKAVCDNVRSLRPYGKFLGD